MHPLDKCFQCGAAIPLRYGYVPMCQPCMREYLIDCEKRRAWDKRLSAMGARPGKKTHRAARLEAVRSMRKPTANDNGTKFGETALRRKSRRGVR
jgi:hypothetical protein